jgi:L-lactate utilization protein LutB
MRAAYSYQGDATCAADGMCQEKCPVKINTGELIKSIRAEELKAAGANASRAEALSMVRAPRCAALARARGGLRAVRGRWSAVLPGCLLHTGGLHLPVHRRGCS